MLQDFIIIVQSDIPISTAAPTHYVSFSTLISYAFFKTFSKIFWALFWHPRGSCPLFSNSPSPATRPHIFSRRLDLISHFILQGIETPDDFLQGNATPDY